MRIYEQSESMWIVFQSFKNKQDVVLGAYYLLDTAIKRCVNEQLNNKYLDTNAEIVWGDTGFVIYSQNFVGDYEYRIILYKIEKRHKENMENI